MQSVLPDLTCGVPVRSIRVAVVEGSPLIRNALARLLDREPGIELVGTGSRGGQLLAQLVHWRADLILLDLMLPGAGGVGGMGGLTTLEELQFRRSTPVILLADNPRRSALLAVEALHLGAVDCLDKRELAGADGAAWRMMLVERIRQLGRPRFLDRGVEETPVSLLPVAMPQGPPAVLLLGAATGGPPVIERVLRDLGPRPPLPVVVAQHMPAGLTRAFASRLTAVLPLDIRELAHGEPLLPGRVYVVPSGSHATLAKLPGGLCAQLTATADRVQPSIDRLFESAASALGPRAAAALLTGFGEDGAQGLAALSRSGAYTIAQDEATSVAFDMPRAAIAVGAAREVLPLALIGWRLRQLADFAPDAETGPRRGGTATFLGPETAAASPSSRSDTGDDGHASSLHSSRWSRSRLS
jgi:two-component system chemotaxis response regulator CheB